MRILFSLPFLRSLAETLRMPLASMSKVTSILRHAARAGWMSSRLNRPSSRLSGGHRTFALEHLHRDGPLIVVGRGERLLLRGRNGRVAFDQLGHDAAQGFDAQRQRRHVEQQHFRLAAHEELGPLNGGADGDHLVRVDALVPFLAEDFLHQLLDARHARHAADQDDLVDVARLVAGILQGGQHRAPAAFDQMGHQLLELRAGQRELQVLRARTRRP